ncbi:hypothetical protein HYX14_06470 [Candidatus Woesearchaeota archaeon]|nr:hypothetical protein [Candidatus Woesearchaeota archaeon]
MSPDELFRRSEDPEINQASGVERSLGPLERKLLASPKFYPDEEFRIAFTFGLFSGHAYFVMFRARKEGRTRVYEKDEFKDEMSLLNAFASPSYDRWRRTDAGAGFGISVEPKASGLSIDLWRGYRVEPKYQE